MKISNCKSCQAEIIWAKTTKGRPIPLDAAPIGGGPFTTEVDADDLLTAIWVGAPNGSHTTHFETCPDAKKFRKEAPAKEQAKPEVEGTTKAPAEYRLREAANLIQSVLEDIAAKRARQG